MKSSRPPRPLRERDAPSGGDAGHGPVEATVVSGVVSLKRRAMLAPGRGTALRAETGGHWGRLGLYAKRPERLFADLGREV